MSKHAASRGACIRRGFRSTRVRALLSLGVLLGIAAQGTLAYWTDSATMSGGQFTSGTLNMRLDDGTASPEPTTYSIASLTDMVPGESFAVSVPVLNAGSVAFTYSATGVTSGMLAPHLTFHAHVGGAAQNGGTDFRTGTCTGSTSLGNAQLLDTSKTVVASRGPIAASSSETLCFVVTLANDTPSTMQGKVGTATFTFTADQIQA